MPAAKSDYTPSEELILEVVAARYRLGHNTGWPFHKVHKKSLMSLQKKGMIYVNFGHVEDTYDVQLTSAGLKHMLSGTYTPPIYKFVKDEFIDAFITHDTEGLK